MTKDERFLIEIYKILQTLSERETIDPLTIAKSLGFKEKLTQDIIKGLSKANLIKKIDSDEFVLTERGKEVARSLLKS